MARQKQDKGAAAAQVLGDELGKIEGELAEAKKRANRTWEKALIDHQEQRVAKARKAVERAGNLTRSVRGYLDAMRLEWDMDTEAPKRGTKPQTPGTAGPEKERLPGTSPSAPISRGSAGST